ncbi:hypothetical protein HN358_04460 [Candidatus Uhrbacteria bacterium]|jgi:hypothetical protein|nr:hypothetical protein [Candidatus Uhrbacteria bacterium]MBT7717036.1 hypothetical protein [Candidatus Uhrbacteria bacterium]
MEKKNRIWALVGLAIILLGLIAIGVEFSWQVNDPRNIVFPRIMSTLGALMVLLGGTFLTPILKRR